MRVQAELEVREIDGRAPSVPTGQQGPVMIVTSHPTDRTLVILKGPNVSIAVSSLDLLVAVEHCRWRAAMSEFDELLAKVRSLPPPTEREKQEQSFCFAYGQLAASTNHRPRREIFRKYAMNTFGWSEEDFDHWAEGKEWAP